MNIALKGALVGALTLAGSSLGALDAEAMPVQPLAPAAVSDGAVQQVYWRYGYGYRRPFVGYGYGFRRPFLGYRPFAYGRFGYGRFGYGGFRGYGYGRRW